MGFVIGIGSSGSLHPPISVSLPSSRKKPRSCFCSCPNGHGDEFNGNSKRRAFLLVGVSVVPHLLQQCQLEVHALEYAAAVGNILTRKRLIPGSEETNAKTNLKNPKAEDSTGDDMLARKRFDVGSDENIAETNLKNPKAEESNVESAQSNPSALLNGVGVFSSGVLGTLYALGWNEKEAADAALESISNSVKVKETEISSLEERYKALRVNEQEEQTKSLKRSSEEKQSILVQLNLANTTIVDMEQELTIEKRLVTELKAEKDAIQTKLSKIEENRRLLGEILKDNIRLVENLEERISLLSSELELKEENIRGTNSDVANKELELIDANSRYKTTKYELAKAHLEKEKLKTDILNQQKDSETKIAEITELNSMISTLASEKEDATRKFVAVEKELIDLRAFSEKAAAANAKLSEERQKELHLLNEELKWLQTQTMENEKMISELMKERDVVKKQLDKEASKLNSLKQELSVTKELLVESAEEASNFVKQLGESQRVSAEFEAELSSIRTQYTEEMSLLLGSLDDTKQKEEELVGQVSSLKALLQKTKDELQKVSQELASAKENCESLQKEFVDVHKKVESAANDMKEDKKLLSSLKQEVEATKKQVAKDKEGRGTLIAKLEEATRLLDQMRQNAEMLSRDFEVANSRVNNLKNEREALCKSVTDRKKASKEVQGNLEDAHYEIIRLGKERENLDKRLKRLEQELASAKGEILRLRSQTSLPTPVANDDPPAAAEVKEKVTVSGKSNVRRRRGTASE